MRVVVVGATGNVGTSVLAALAADDAVDSILGLARRIPEISFPKTTWAAADVTRDDLVHQFRGADAVIHLAWAIQPSHDLETLRAINVDGSRRVFEAVAEAGVGSLVYASSIGAYSPGSKDYRIDESWPTHGISTSFYSRHKAAVERILDSFEQEHPGIRVVRLRPALIFKREAATEVRRLFIGPFLPNVLVQRGLIPVIPVAEGLKFQCVHSYDIGAAYKLAALGDARGAFNIAAEPVLGADELREIFGARPIKIPRAAFRLGAAATWRLHLQPTPEGWVDMAFATPLLDTTRATKELGWAPSFTAQEALVDLLDGLREGASVNTPPLSDATTGPLRVRELLQGIGRRSGVE